MQKRIVNKVDVVEAQLSEAVRLFFEQRDLIVVHTLVASAHQILIDISKHRGIGSQVKNVGNLGKPEVQAFMKSVNYPYNFFKHADRDPEAELNVGPMFQFTADFLMDAVLMLQGITESLPTQAKIYWAWFVSYYHEQFDNLPKNGEIAKLQEQGLGRKPFEELAQLLKFSEIVEDCA